MIGKSGHARRFVGIGFLVLVLAAGAAAFAMWSYASPCGAFKRFVIRPIPRSVRSIEVDHCQISTLQDRTDGYQESAVVLRFDIGKDDLLRIVEARGFKPFDHVWCYEGTLYYGSDARAASTIALYGPDREAPSWFDLNSDNWPYCDAYLLGETDRYSGLADASFLLYREQLGRAYLIKWVVIDRYRR